MRSIKKLAPTFTLLAGVSLSGHPASAETLLRMAESPPGQLDPDKAADDAGSHLAFNLYDTLVIPAQGKPSVEPHLAASWTSDGNSYTFKLRPDVKFHSGNTMTADDVVYSFKRLMALGQGFSFLFEGVVTVVEVVDPTTVKMTLSGPSAPFLASLVRLPILDSKFLKQHQEAGKYGEFGDYSDAWLSAHDAGTGAYQAQNHNPQDRTELVKFPGYFLGVPAKAPDRVILRYGIPPSTIRTLMASGEHEIASGWTPPEVIKALAARDDIHLLTVRSGFMYYLQLNTTVAPLDDPHCRRALALAADYKTMAKLMEITPEVNQALPANGPLGADTFGHDPAVPNMKQDLTAAKAEAAQCRYKPADAPPIEIASNSDVPVQERFSLLLGANFGALGFKTTISKGTWAELTQRMTDPKTTPGLFQLWSVPVTPDPDSLLTPTYFSKAPHTFMNSVNLNDQDVDGLLQASRTEVDPDKRMGILQKLDARLVELSPTIYAYQYQAVFATSRKVTAPALSDDTKRFSLSTYNFAFRLFEMNP